MYLLKIRFYFNRSTLIKTTRLPTLCLISEIPKIFELCLHTKVKLNALFEFRFIATYQKRGGGDCLLKTQDSAKL